MTVHSSRKDVEISIDYHPVDRIKKIFEAQTRSDRLKNSTAFQFLKPFFQVCDVKRLRSVMCLTHTLVDRKCDYKTPF